MSAESLRNLEYVDWEKVIDELSFPMYLKPHWGGGWRDVSRVTSREELFATYDRTSERTMILQEEIAWTQYVRCIVIGKEAVRPALWDPRRSHFERYTHAAAMPVAAELFLPREWAEDKDRREKVYVPSEAT